MYIRFGIMQKDEHNLMQVSFSGYCVNGIRDSFSSVMLTLMTILHCEICVIFQLATLKLRG